MRKVVYSGFTLLVKPPVQGRLNVTNLTVIPSCPGVWKGLF